MYQSNPTQANWYANGLRSSTAAVYRPVGGRVECGSSSFFTTDDGVPLTLQSTTRTAVSEFYTPINTAKCKLLR